MDKKLLLQTTKHLLAVPTAAFHEQWLQAAILHDLSRYKSINSEFDRFGNLLLRYRPTKKKAKLCFQAHLDHPGFVATSTDTAEVLGNTPTNIAGAKLRFFSKPAGQGIQAKIVGNIKKQRGREVIGFKSSSLVTPGSIGMWDLPAYKQVGSWLEGRAFDDNLCAAVLVYLLKWAATKKSKNSFDVLLTRAEEVGYIGTWALLKHKTFTLPNTVINLEVPREMIAMPAGAGVVVRAGDRNCFFDPDLLNFLASTCEKITKVEKNFKYQKGLGLLGGIEATSFQLHGYKTASLCVAVQNGHNVSVKNSGRPAPERASLTDYYSLVMLLQELTTAKLDYAAVNKTLTKKIEKNYRNYSKDLKRGVKSRA